MSAARGLRIVRQTLVAGVLTAIRPPVAFTQVVVGNGTTGDVLVYTNDDLTQSEYRAIAAGYERPVRAYRVNGFRSDETAFWLLSNGGGTVILEWS